MELSHLVHTLTRRPLLSFAICGAILWGGRQLLITPVVERAPLEVVVASGASAAEVREATDEAILLTFAVRSGFVERDPAVRDRLIRNLRFADERLTDQEAMARAIALGMHRTDPVARRRLVWLAGEALASATRRVATDEELSAYARAHAARFARPPVFTFEQVFVSRERNAGFEARVRHVQQQLEMGAGETLSDLGLLPHRMQRASPTRIDARFGVGFARAVQAHDGAGWSDAIPSAFGVHFVRISERVDGALPELPSIRARVRHEHERDSRRARLRGALSRMREAYRIVVKEQG